MFRPLIPIKLLVLALALLLTDPAAVVELALLDLFPPKEKNPPPPPPVVVVLGVEGGDDAFIKFVSWLPEEMLEFAKLEILEAKLFVVDPEPDDILLLL